MSTFRTVSGVGEALGLLANMQIGAQVAPQMDRQQSTFVPDEIAAEIQKFARSFKNDLVNTRIYSSTQSSVEIAATKFSCLPPTALFAKQKNNSAPQVWLSRQREVDIRRTQEISRLLLQGHTVGLLGMPGTGKSNSALAFYIQFFEMLEAGTLDIFYFRLDGHLFCARWDVSDVLPEAPCGVSVMHTPTTNSFEHQVNYIGQQVHDKTYEDIPPTAVFICEFYENELSQKTPNLEFAHSFGLLYVTSNRDMGYLTKALAKADEHHVFIMDKHSEEEAMLCAEAMFDLDPETCKWAHNNGTLMTKSAALDTMRLRIEKVGPILRYILGSNEMYNVRVMDMKQARDASGALGELSVSTSIYNAPPLSSLYIGLSLREGVTVPKVSLLYRDAVSVAFFQEHEHEEYYVGQWDGPIHCFSVHSPMAAQMLLQAVSTPVHIEVLRSLHLLTPMQELVVRRVLNQIANDDFDIAKKYQLSKWDLCRDPGAGVGLCQPLLLIDNFREQAMRRWKRCNAELTFAGDICRIPACDLPANTIVRSTSASMWIGEHLTADHANRKPMVSMFQVSSSAPSSHVFALGNLVEVLTALELHPGGRCEQYSFELVYVTDWTYDVLDGLAFRYPVVGSDPVQYKTIGLVEWRAKLREFAVISLGLERARTAAAAAAAANTGVGAARARAASAKAKAVAKAAEEVSKQETAAAEFEKNMPQQDWAWIPRKVRGIIVRGALFPTHSKVDLPVNITDNKVGNALRRYHMINRAPADHAKDRFDRFVRHVVSDSGY